MIGLVVASSLLAGLAGVVVVLRALPARRHRACLARIAVLERACFPEWFELRPSSNFVASNFVTVYPVGNLAAALAQRGCLGSSEAARLGVRRGPG